MQLESLANELLFEIFEFLDGIHLLRAFHGLNSRFNILLYDNLRNYHFNFQSVSKRDFDWMCQQHLSSIVDRVISLHLSEDETPNLINHFLAYGFTLNQFAHLRSLSLLQISSLEKINAILTESTSLAHLTHLKLIPCPYGKSDDVVRLINNIWRLPKLTHCNLFAIDLQDHQSARLKVISSSLEYLSIQGHEISSRDLLSYLLKNAIRLRHLRVNLVSDSIVARRQNSASSIFRLDIIVAASKPAMIHLLQNTPNLRHLTIRISHFSFDGHEWKQMIVNHLPHIKIFRLRMESTFRDQNRKDDEVDQLLETFRTPFWLNERHWFVRCGWSSQDADDSILLYTLPYCFNGFYDIRDYKTSFKSTCPDERDYWSYDCVHKLSLRNIMNKNWSGSRIRFPNIDNLRINFPVHHSIWSRIPMLDNLTSLHISIDEGTVAESVLHVLLDRTPRLYSLTINGLLALPLINWKTISPSIRRLDFSFFSCFDDLYFNTSQCSALINSPLGRQCEVLTIKVEDRSSVLDLVNSMLNLRMLICKFGEEKKDIIRPITLGKDELVTWLQDHLPSACSISRTLSHIQLWISSR